jgi:TM2 domain-containing membrane protein YozV
MAKMDKMLATMHNRNIRRAIMGADQTMQLESLIATTSGPYLTGEQLQEAVLEILPDDDITRLLSGEEFEFDYDSPSGTYKFVIERANSGLQVTVTPLQQLAVAPLVEQQPTPPPAPLPTEVAPVQSAWEVPPPPPPPAATAPNAGFGVTPIAPYSPPPQDAIAPVAAPYGSPPPPNNPPVGGPAMQGYGGAASAYNPHGLPHAAFPMPDLNNQTSPCSRIVGGLLGIFLGGLGIHRFYLGYTSAGVAYLIASIVIGLLTCGVVTAIVSLIGFIEGIVILCGGMKDSKGRELSS